MPHLILIQNDYPDSGALLRVLNYALNSDLIGGYGLSPENAYHQMSLVKAAYHKTDGNQLLHWILSFSTSEACRLDMDEMLAYGYWVSHLFGAYQTAYALHSNSRNFHLHLVTNTINFDTGLRYSDGRAAFWRIRNALQREFPRSDVGIYVSYPLSDINRYMEADADSEFLRIG